MSGANFFTAALMLLVLLLRTELVAAVECDLVPELDRQCAFQGAKLPAENLDASEFEIKMTYRTYEIIDNVTIFYYEIKVLDVANSGDAASALSKAVLGVEKCTEVFVSYNFSDFQAVDPAVDEDTCIEGVVVPAAVQPGDSVNVQIKVKGEIDQGLVNFALASADGGFYGFSAIEGPNCVCDPVEEEEVKCEVKMTASEDNYAGGQSYFTYLVEYNCPVAFFEIEEDVNCTRDAGFVMKSDISSVNVESVKGLKLAVKEGTVLVNLDDNFHVQVVAPGRPCFKDIPVDVTFDTGEMQSIIMKGPDCSKQCTSVTGNDKCKLLPEIGTCQAQQTKWFYNFEVGYCEQFSYSGCGGNTNNFISEGDCENACMDLIKELEPSYGFELCEGDLQRWYYDSDYGECKQFSYSGCRGNANNFFSLEECQLRTAVGQKDQCEFIETCTSTFGCAFGYKTDEKGCRTCDCYDPCSEAQCTGEAQCFAVQGHCNEDYQVLDGCPYLPECESPDEWGCSYHKDRTCHKDAVCIDYTNDKGRPAYKCECPLPFTGNGTYCGLETRECLKDELEIEGMCYSHSDDPEDWYHAAETCRKKGGSLAEVTSTYVKTQLTDFLQDLYPDGKKFYFGLNSLGYRDEWTFNSGAVNQWLSDGREFTKQEGNCAAITAPEGAASNDLCCLPKRFICQIPKNAVPCPFGWIFDKDENKCFYYSASESRTVSFAKAHKLCTSLGATLACPRKVTDVDVLRYYMVEEDAPYWFGGLVTCPQVDDGDCKVVCSSGGDPIEEDVLSYFPAGYENKDATAVYYLDQDSLTAIEKDDKELHHFICERPVHGKNIICPSNTREFLGRCYQLVQIPQVANKSEDMCADNGMRLAFMKDEIHRNMVKDYVIDEFTSIYMSLGGISAAKEEHGWTAIRFWARNDNNEIGCYGLTYNKEGYAEYFEEQDCSEAALATSLCEFAPQECYSDEICGIEGGECLMGVCTCPTGKYGSGIKCQSDVDTCLMNPCDKDATCKNREDECGFKCFCNEGFYGDGFECLSYRHCTKDKDCLVTAECNQDELLCECLPGYEGDGMLNCTDIDECGSTWACSNYTLTTCENTVGSYECVCRPGSMLNEQTGECEKIPLNCQEGYDLGRIELNGTSLLIDPDGEGPLLPFIAECAAFGGVFLTIIENGDKECKTTANKNNPVQETKVFYDTEEKPVSLDSMVALVDNSGYCIQRVIVCGKFGVNFGSHYSIYGRGEKKLVGLDTGVNGTCPSGLSSTCDRPRSFSCNINDMELDAPDIADINDKELLPITSFEISDLDAKMQGGVTLGPLVCAPKPFSLFASCKDALKYSHHVSNTFKIDPDGPNGPGLPFYARCVYQEKPEAFLTFVTPTISEESTTDANGCSQKNVTYLADLNNLKTLVDNSEFCRQKIEYSCLDAPIIGSDGLPQVGWLNRYSKTSKTFATPYSTDPIGCPCALTGSCKGGELCNCDVKDGVRSSDQGFIIDSDTLPVTGLHNCNPESNGDFALNSLVCGTLQFGIPKSCQEYRYRNVIESGPFLIDPDGPGELKPFMAYCEMKADVFVGKTVINAELNTEVSSESEKFYFFKEVTLAQIEALKAASTYCVQQVKISCDDYPLFAENGSPNLFLKDANNKNIQIAHGDASQGCACGTNKTCTNKDSLCNCDAGGQNTDVIVLTDNAVPVRGYATSGTAGTVDVEIGPIECYQIAKTCSGRETIVSQYEQVLCLDEVPLGSDFVIDPDGALGVDMFPVDCSGSRTSLKCEIGGSLDAVGKKCFDTQCDITQEQVKALRNSSVSCQQIFYSESLNTPIFKDGKSLVQITNGLGDTSLRSEGCLCSIANDCVGGPEDKCNADAVNGEVQYDQQTFTMEDGIPITQICVEKTNDDGYLKQWAGPLMCDDKNLINAPVDCFDGYLKSKNPSKYPDFVGRFQTSGMELIDPDGVGGTEAWPVYCKFNGFYSVNEITVTEIEREGSFYFEYHQTQEQIDDLKNYSSFCYQDIFICSDAATADEVDVTFATFSQEEVAFKQLDAQSSASKCPSAGKCDCQGGQKLFYARVSKNSELPLVSYTPGSGKHDITVSDITCSPLERNCYDIAKNRDYATLSTDIYYPSRQGNEWPVDGDADGENEPLLVNCYFQQGKHGEGLHRTEIVNCDDKSALEELEGGEVQFSCAPGGDFGNGDQVHGVVQSSAYCRQKIDYNCGAGTFTIKGKYGMYGYDGKYPFFAGADNEGDNYTGCACSVIGTCEDDQTCHCEGGPASLDRGTITNRDVLPIKNILLEGNKQSLKVSSLQCANRIFDTIQSCKNVKKSGEYILYLQNTEILVYCDCEMKSENHCVLMLPHDSEDSGKITADDLKDGPIEKEIKYPNTPVEDLKKIRDRFRCYQEVLYTSNNTPFTGVVSWFDVFGNQWTRWGNSEKDGQCECYPKCADESLPCSTDKADGFVRSDGGTMVHVPRQGSLPIVKYRIESVAEGKDSFARVEIGNLYCIDQPTTIKFDECSRGFSDCHPNANCYDEDLDFRCVCDKDGYAGNGRECLNVDECQEGLSDCHSQYGDCTDTDGSFECACVEGFQGDGYICEDINECEQSPCHKDAVCTNTIGSFRCRCKYGFSGDGIDTCEPTCSCLAWGDPHYITCDGRVHHYMGTCIYRLIHHCPDQKYPDPDYSDFDVWIHNKQDLFPNGAKAGSFLSSVRQVTVIFGNETITLHQEKEVRRENITVTLPLFTPTYEVRHFGTNIKVKSRLHKFELFWDGVDRVEVNIPDEYKENICGLCGNYNDNPDDDMTVDGVDAPVNEWGGSWAVGGDPGCSSEYNMPDCPNNSPEHKAAKDMCGILTDPKQRFAPCHPYLDPQPFYEACLIDVCAFGDERLCDSLDSYATSCRKVDDKLFPNWRDDLCEIKCPNNMEYDSCASPCQATCQEKEQTECKADLGNGKADCVDGCVCPKGLIRDGDRCVENTNCGCFEKKGTPQEVYYPSESSHLTDDCSQNCSCINGEITCRDINCDSSIAQCGLVEGAITCSCDFPNYRWNPETGICDDVDECIEKIDSCDFSAICSNNVGSFNCTCKEGFVGDGYFCDDIDECDDEGACPDNSDCENTFGSFDCNCHPGFIASADKSKCDDVDECANKGSNACHRPSTDCENTVGGYKCNCKEGFKNDNETEFRCGDIDECKQESDNCGDNAHCTNTVGSFDCNCVAGYEGDGVTCTNIDECKNPKSCDPNANCKDTVGSYECTCKTGYSGTGQKCDDDNECADERNDCEQVCINTPGSFKCECNPGFEGITETNKECTDTDECKLEPCDENASCENTVGSFVCDCEEGFEGSGIFCDDINECNRAEYNYGDCYANCSNTFGSYDCFCPDGFLEDEATGVCNDIDECADEDHNCHDNAECTNTNGGYTCKCNKGYKGDGKRCEDKDECKNGEEDCNENAECRNVPGEYKCSCNRGFEGNGFNCSDVDECKENPCTQDNVKCVNTVGSYKCNCEAGYARADRTNPDSLCISAACDADTAIRGDYLCEPNDNGIICSVKEGGQAPGSGNGCDSTDACPVNSECKQATGTDYTCSCSKGFSLDESCGCSDDDECAGEGDGADCATAANCSNTEGSYECNCRKGYTGDGKTCEDEDECKKDDSCDETEFCKNNVGSYSCLCLVGYERNDDGDCENIDECALDLDDCHEHSAECVDTPGFWECKCKEGVRGDGKTCEDIDECAENTADCKGGSTCENTFGSYVCECDTGYFYAESEPYCRDIDECKKERDSCIGPFEMCENTEGSYTCGCANGYRRNDQGLCENINECEEEDPCLLHQVCFDTQGGVNCECVDGYIMNGNGFCRDENECKQLPCADNEVCANTVGSYDCHCKIGYTRVGDKCEDDNECRVDDNPGYDCDKNADCTNTGGSYICSCHEGYQGNGKECSDIDECKMGLHTCGFNTRCENSEGGFHCLCDSGFMGDCNQCTDVNECAYGIHDCPETSTCVNFDGGYDCHCPPGLRMADFRKICIDINECDEGLFDCPEFSVCVNEYAGHSCKCQPGYETIGNGTACVDKDECDTGPTNCHINAKCINFPGTYSCVCKDGYFGDGIEDCRDVNECFVNNTCSNFANCKNTEGSYLCECPLGFAGNGIQCEDINECATSPCAGIEECINTYGSYSCRCPNGTVFDGQKCSWVDSCLNKPQMVCQHGSCQSLPEYEYKCECLKGYEYDAILGYCVPHDYCGLFLHDCDLVATCYNGETQNSPDGAEYSCECPLGYILAEDKKTCLDINECALNIDVCDKSTRECINNHGSYYCQCLPGLVGTPGGNCAEKPKCTLRCPQWGYCRTGYDGSQSCQCYIGFEFKDGDCVEINECELGVCGENTACKNTFGSFECECEDGFLGDPYHGCFDENECMRNACPDNSVCVNKFPGYDCECEPDFEPILDDSGMVISCIFNDSLGCFKNGDMSCGPQGQCVFNPQSGLQECLCLNGYYSDLHNQTCRDIDECLADNVCHNAATCHNIEGSFYCTCDEGYVGDGFHCKTQDCCEVLACDENAECTEWDVEEFGAKCSCECDEGYVGDGISCFDVDECESNAESCPEHSTCYNAKGSFVCDCHGGFIKEGDYECIDIDECRLETAKCHANAVCRNYPGGYTCQCKAGFYGNGFDCIDIDECYFGSYCGKATTCENTVGSYICKCPSGYIADGFDCIMQEHCDECGVNATCQIRPSGAICGCKVGFTGDGYDCQDINECASLSALRCDERAICVNLPGGYECQCPKGYEMVENTCVDLDECDFSGDEAACHPTAECVNEIGSFHCTCPNDQVKHDDGSCIQYHACEEEDWQSVCDPDAECLERGHTYQCRCRTGFFGNGLECLDINECLSGEADCGSVQTCVNTMGSYECKCSEGYELTGSGTCRDVDECGAPADNECHQNSTCTNMGGLTRPLCKCDDPFVGNGYDCVAPSPCEDKECGDKAYCTEEKGEAVCKCHDGFEGDGMSCSPVDLCADVSTNECSTFAECVNLNPGYECKCKPGFIGNGFACEKYDACKQPGDGPCYPGTECIASSNGYKCSCGKGFDDDCDDVDECATLDTACKAENTECVNFVGGFLCKCQQGFQFDASMKCVACEGDCQCTEGQFLDGSGNCKDVDECALGLHTCDSRTQACKNSEGSFTCACKEGLKEDESGACVSQKSCADNPCADKNSKCVEDGISFGYLCLCTDGYVADAQGNCVDYDECKPPYDNYCVDKQFCKNTEGGFKCGCRNGYANELDSGECKDVNECMLKTDNCDKESSLCVNSFGDFYCVCRPGFESAGDWRSCQDVDECSNDGWNTCSENKKCVNNVGSYTCECRNGFKLNDEQDCEDIDECAETPNLCGDYVGATCTNTLGSFICECDLGADLVGNRCVPINNCIQQDHSHKAEYCSRAEICVDNSQGYTCSCPEGYTVENDDGNNKCVDIDECETGDDDCHGNAICVNVLGGFMCYCKNGFEQTGENVCEDRDECKSALCGPEAHCINTNGSFVCQCDDGYREDAIGYCVNIDECAEGSHACTEQQTCYDLVGTYECKCSSGYKLVNGKCEDIDECRKKSLLCDPNADCENTQGGYNCVCKQGFDGNGKFCFNICDKDACPNSLTCVVSDDNRKECSCVAPEYLMNIKGPVCGTDGNTYASAIILFQHACQAGLRSLKMDYYGKCKKTCEEVDCPFSSECQWLKGKPTCLCQPCDHIDPNEDNRVCSNTYEEFQSECHLNLEVCEYKIPGLIKQNDGPCSQDCEYERWSSWSSCDAECGTAYSHRTRKIKKHAVGNGYPCNQTLEDTIECKLDPCPGTACALNNTCGHFEECVSEKVGDDLVCRCPTCEVTGQTAAVCGSDGKNYQSECQVRLDACASNKRITVERYGHCDSANPPADVPLMCTVVKKMINVTVDGCFPEEHDVGMCSGGCASMEDYCCRPKKTRVVDKPVPCFDGSVRTTKVEEVLGCVCRCMEDDVITPREYTNLVP